MLTTLTSRIESRWIEAGSVALGALALFAATMPRVITFEDAGLFDSVCYTNGIAHPPGYPLFTLMCAPLFQLPFTPAIIGNSMSAVFGALACGVLVLVLRRLNCGRGAAMFGGALLAVSAGFWSQSIIVEVYSLNALIFLLVLYLCICFYQEPDRRLAWLICLFYSLGISNHWPLMVLAFPGLALICFSRWDWISTQIRDLRFWAMVIFMVLLGISPYATLLLKHHTMVSYSGPIDGIHGLWGYFMRKAYAGVDHQAVASIIDKVDYAAWLTRLIAVQATPWALPLLLPAWLVGHRLTGKPIQIGLALIFLANTYGLVALLGFQYEYIFRAVFLPYPMLAWCCLALWFGIGMQWLVERVTPLTRFAPALLVIVGVTSISLTAIQNARVNNRSKSTISDDYSRLILKTVAPHAAIVVSSDSQAFTLAYQKFVNGLRPDVTLYHLNNLIYPNKLPGKTLAQRVKAIETMALHRPVYSIGLTALPLDTDYGIFARHDLPGDPPAARDDRHAAFRHHLIVNYLAGKYTQPHELFFANQLLLGFSNQLTALARLGPLNAGEATDLSLLGRTFPGTLATMYTALTDPHFALPGQVLVDLAFRMDEHIPPEAANEDRAQFHYYFALLFLRGQYGIKIDKSLARELLLKSFSDWPSPHTPGLCLLLQMNPPAGHLSTTPRFRKQCPVPAGEKD